MVLLVNVRLTVLGPYVNMVSASYSLNLDDYTFLFSKVAILREN